jgi:UDP-N-acetylmuramoylalanine-D-glutamate ligase
MVKYITRIDANKLDEEKYKKLLETLEYCRIHDKYSNFNYIIANKIIRISSPDLIIAKKRGFYIKKKFQLFFNILKEE